MHRDGASKRNIARQLKMSKNTVKDYLHKLMTIGGKVDELLKLDDPVLERQFHGGNPAYSDDRHQKLMEQMDYYSQELNGSKGVTRQLLWEEYKASTTPHYSYSQFCYHLLQHIRAKKPSMVLNHSAADKLMIDFSGQKMQYIDRDSGEVIQCELFVATFPFSGFCYVQALRSQSLDDFVYGTVRCLSTLGGVPKALVTDNLKSSITKSHRYEPDVNQVFEQLANHYNCTVFPTRVYKPKDKAAVEGSVRIIYSRVKAPLRNRQFFSLSELNSAIEEQVLLLNQRRMQTRGYTREEQFVAAEKPLLGALPTAPFEIQYTKDYKVAQNNHFMLGDDKHYYSVPYTYIGQRIKVIYTRHLVQVYHKGQLICQHLRDKSTGRYSTDQNHLCSAHKAYLQRSPQYYIDRASKVSNALEQIFIALFDQPGRYPEQLYKSCDGWMALSRKYKNNTEFQKACQISIEQGNYTYGFVKRILDNKMTDQQPASQPEASLPLHHNIRGKQYYQTELFKQNRSLDHS